MSDTLTPTEIAEAVRAEMRLCGSPIATYMRLVARANLGEALALSLTNETFKNLEARIVVLEREFANQGLI